MVEARREIMLNAAEQVKAARTRLFCAARTVDIGSQAYGDVAFDRILENSVTGYERAVERQVFVEEASGLELNWFEQGEEMLSMISGTLHGSKVQVVQYLAFSPVITSGRTSGVLQEVMSSSIAGFKDDQPTPIEEALGVYMKFGDFLSERNKAEGQDKPLPWRGQESLFEHYQKIAGSTI